MRSLFRLCLASVLALSAGTIPPTSATIAGEPPVPAGVVPNVATPPKTEPLKNESLPTAKAAPSPTQKAGDPAILPPMPVADGLKLPADVSVDPKELYVTIVADTKGEDVNWIVVASVPVKYTPLAKTIVVGVPPGAVIHVYAYATVEGKATTPARTVITVKGSPVTPVTPANPPDAGKAQSRAHVTLVEDSAARLDNPWLGELINDRKFRDALTAEGVTFRVVDVKDPEIESAKLKPYLEAAGKLPTLIVQDDAGKVFDPQPVPKTASSALDAIRKAVAKSQEK